MSGDYWDQYGTSDVPLIDVTSEAFARGEPAWPAGFQRYRIVRTWQSLAISTEGLGTNEVFLEMPGAQGWLPAQVHTQWQFQVLRSVARTVAGTSLAAGSPHIVVPVPAPTSAPMQLYSELDGAMIVAVIVGMTVPGRQRAHDGVNYLPATPITAREFTYIYSGGYEELAAVVNGRVAGGFHHVVIDSPAVTDLLDEQLS